MAIELTPEQRAEVVNMIGELKEARENVPSIRCDPDEHLARGQKILDTSAKLARVLPPEIDPV